MWGAIETLIVVEVEIDQRTNGRSKRRGKKTVIKVPRHWFKWQEIKWACIGKVE